MYANAHPLLPYQPVALGHSNIALEEGSSGQATGHPLNGYHLALAGDERLRSALFHIGGANSWGKRWKNTEIS